MQDNSKTKDHHVGIYRGDYLNLKYSLTNRGSIEVIITQLHCNTYMYVTVYTVYIVCLLSLIHI